MIVQEGPFPSEDSPRRSARYDWQKDRWILTDHTYIPAVERALPWGTSEAQVRLLVGCLRPFDYVQAVRDADDLHALRRMCWSTGMRYSGFEEWPISADWRAIAREGLHAR